MYTFTLREKKVKFKSKNKMKKTLLFVLFITGAIVNNLSAQIVFQSDFETWTGIQAVTGWNGSKTNIVATPDSAKKDSVLPYHGTYCVKLVNPSTTAKRFSTQPMAVTAGTLYNVRFWAKGAGSVRTGLNGVKNSTGFGYLYGAYVVVSSPTWAVYTQQLLADSTNASAQFLLSVKSTLAASGNLAIDSVTITNGGTATVSTLYGIQFTTASPANSAFMNQYVTTGGIVTAVAYSGTPATQNSYYVQTTGAHAWSAVFVYDFAHPVAIGDSITFSGLVEEYYNETEIANISNFTKVSSGNPVPAVTLVDLTSIQKEQYEGMLVKVKDVNEVRYNTASAWYVFADSTGGIDTVDNNSFTYAFTQGKRYTITGVVHFENANWIEPRNIGDIDSVNVSSGIRELENAFSNMNIYPNPNNGLFTVSVDILQDEKTMDVMLTDITGRVIYNKQVESHKGPASFQMNTTNYERGTYFLEIRNAQSRTVRKLIVQ
jgi:predicted extracellular nuclease